MNLNPLEESPFKLQISFHKIIEHYEQVAATQTGPQADRARAILKETAPFPELKDGFTTRKQITGNTQVIHNLLADLFPEILTDNEIKAVSIPFQDILFNPTRRLQKILDAAGPDFNINIRDSSDEQFYVLSCCIILDEFYGSHFNFSKPLFYDIPSANGIVKHYRILYNADFLELVPTENAVTLTADDIDLLRDNYNNYDLWKEKFPPGSWILKGFGIMSLFDATVENAVSSLKGTLLTRDSSNINMHDEIENVFRSIYKVPDLRIGFVSYNPDEKKFVLPTFSQQLTSFLLPDEMQEEFCNENICSNSVANVVTDQIYFAVSDVSKYLQINPQSILAKRFKEQNINSFILAPVIKNDNFLGVLELVSSRKGELNSINANQLDVVMPFITDTIERKFTELQNQIQALIQDEYTSIHPSVYWKFKREALKYIQHHNAKKEYVLKQITFNDVYPLYGQIDIKGSSDTRNLSLQLDLQEQLKALIPLVGKLQPKTENVRLQKKIYKLEQFAIDLQETLKADTEQQVMHYVEKHIHPMLKQAIDTDHIESGALANYLKQLEKTGDFHANRRKYETTVTLINKRMADMLDSWQVSAQKSYPHYYERFKTDGVEHNLYIGAEIAPTREFSLDQVYNLRLWQLQVLCEMELEHHFTKDTLPYPLEVTSLILAFSTPLSIRFRMDEKRFDVDGTYNARFEIVKKRIDKAFIKGTTERITAIGKLTIVYTNHDEEQEYMGYIRFLQSKQMLGKVEMLEIEDLQGISGLKAIRVAIAYNVGLSFKKCFSYDEMLQEIDIADIKKGNLKLQEAK
jgi:hypothetical protein